MTFSYPIPAVLLPGMDGTGDLLTSFAARLAAHRPVDIIAYPAGQPLGYAALQTYIESRLPAGRFVVIGESFSGPLAIAVAATNERTAGLILASRFANHPLPSFLVKLAPYAKLAWVPTALAVALLLGRHTARAV